MHFVQAKGDWSCYKSFKSTYKMCLLKNYSICSFFFFFILHVVNLNAMLFEFNS